MMNGAPSSRTKAMIEIETTAAALAPNSAQEQNKMISRIEDRNSKQRNSQSQNSLAGACSVLLMLLAGQPGVAQQNASVKPAAAATASVHPAATVAANSAEKKSEAEAPGKSLDGTIKVHGHWVINVRNPDGTVADHREFENSLAIDQGGDAFLIGLLAGYYVPGDFGIEIDGVACHYACGIVTSPSTWPGLDLCQVGDDAPGHCSTTLSYNAVLAPSTGSTSFILSGSILAPDVGTLVEVRTFFNACNAVNGYHPVAPIVAPPGPSTVPPSDCHGTTATALVGYLTVTGAFTPVQITIPGQNIEVTVTITFA
jgi:hypothetical protein